MSIDRWPTRCLIVSILLVAVGCAPAALDTAAPGTRARKEVVREVFAAIDAQDFDRLRELWPEDAICHLVGAPEPMDREATIGLISGFYAAFPDNRHELHEMVAEGDLVMVRVTNRMTHRNEYEGLAPTGSEVESAAVHMIKFEGGEIAEWWLLEDQLGFMLQLGMQVVPPSAEESIPE